MIKTFIEKNSGLIFGSTLLLGILLPLDIKNIGNIIKILLILMLYISFLNVDFSHIKKELKHPGELLIQIVWNFLLVPVILFFIIQQLGFPQFAIAAMLLAAMPGGLAGPVLTNIAGGRVATSIVITVVTHIIAPLSLPLLFWIFTDLGVDIDVISLTTQLSILVGVPIGMALISRTYLKKMIKSSIKYHKIISILALTIVAYLVIIPNSETIRNNFLSIIPILIGVYILYSVLCLTSFALSKNREPKEQAAIIITRVYMNNALAIVLAYQFFSPEIALITVLAEIPWFTTFGIYLWFQKKFIGLNPTPETQEKIPSLNSI